MFIIPNIKLGHTNLYYPLNYRHARVAQSEAGKRLKIATVRVQIPLRVLSGCSSVWSECCVWDADVAGSNPVIPINQLNQSLLEIDHSLDLLDRSLRPPVVSEGSGEHVR